MIDLGLTRAGLLAEIGASDPPDGHVSDITDPRVMTADVRVRLCAPSRDDLFPLLKVALAERFAAVPSKRLIADLLMPLKNALGNACKHGNRDNPGKSVRVELVLSRKGALIAVSDEGAGFDVGQTFHRLQSRQEYFENHGAGLLNLHRARSRVTYEDGGRTLLLCFRCDDLPSGAGPAASGRAAPAGRPAIASPEWMSRCLSSELPEFREGRSRIESCCVYPAAGRAAGACGIRYVLRVSGRDRRAAETRVLTGRVHESAAAAEADFARSLALFAAGPSDRVRIPQPIARPASEPRLVLYAFDPWMDLGEYLTARARRTSIRRGARRLGDALADLHRSGIVFPVADTAPLADRFAAPPDAQGDGAVATRTVAALEAAPGGREIADRFEAFVDRVRRETAARPRRPPSPIHGALGWSCIHFAVDSSFYLYRFEACRQSDPGLDLGGFAADLLCFTLAEHDEALYRDSVAELLEHYNRSAAPPVTEEELRPYVVLALAERLLKPGPAPAGRATDLVPALDAALPAGTG